jgi:ribosome modulation factor
MTANKTIEINVNSEAYNTGYEAARQGEPRDANPYCRGTIDAANWLAGWLAGL